MTYINWFEDEKKWEKLTAFGMLEGNGTRNSKAHSQKKFYIASIGDMEQFVKAVRNHWAIEKTL